MYNQVFLLPEKRDDFARAGVILYLLGLVVTVFYFFNFNILSVNFLKPQAIIIGLYIWLFYIVVPRIILLVFASSEYLSRSSFIVGFFFTFLLLIFYWPATLLWNAWSLSRFIGIMANLLAINIYYFNLREKKFRVIPILFRTYIFLPIFCFLFANSVYSVIPNYFAGGQPVKVTVVAKDSTLLFSRFSKSLYLLYESDNEYYFFEKLALDNSRIVFDYKIKRIPKSEIKKIEYIKTLWQPF